ncbi:MAG: Gfo/Idh/MocA family oxidoreductase [Pseudomonadota bacterium]
MVDLKAGVIGTGVFGGFHASKYADSENATLLGVHDQHEDRMSALVEKWGGRAFPTAAALIDAVDVVTIAAPAVSHYALAKAALEAGRHVFVEKPIALDLDEADDLIALADARGLVLQVGHQERFIFDAFGVLGGDKRPVEVECRRNGPFSGRCMDVSVVMDLMIHDLDLLRQVIDSELESVAATARFEHGDVADEVDAALIFQGGVKARLVASRIAETRVRDMRLVYDDGVVEIDFVGRRITNTTPRQLERSFDAGPDAPAFADPLGYGVEMFLKAVRDGAPPPITGADGRAALALALRIEQALA